MKLTADQFYYVYFCMLEEPAMFKPLSYSSEFVSFYYFELITQASRQKDTSRQSRSIYVNANTGIVHCRHIENVCV